MLPGSQESVGFRLEGGVPVALDCSTGGGVGETGSHSSSSIQQLILTIVLRKLVVAFHGNLKAGFRVLFLPLPLPLKPLHPRGSLQLFFAQNIFSKTKQLEK